MKGLILFPDIILLNFILFICTVLLLKLFILNAYKFNLVDVPNKRSAHKKPIPRGAGIVFGFTFIIGIFIFYFLYSAIYSYIFTFFSIIIVYFSGIYDDLYDISSRKKFLFIIFASIIAYYDGFAINSLGNYFGYELYLGYMALPFTIFAIVGFTNALNLSDGLDGLAGSLSIIILFTLLYIGFIYNDTLLKTIPVFLISVLIAFLLFNWSPAKVFMGDSGSLFLGFIISLLSIKSLDYIQPTAILFLAGVPLLDTFMVMRRRKQRGQSLFVADKNHLHHLLLKFKRDKLFTVKILLLMQIVFSLISIQIYNKPDIINIILFGMLFIIFFNLFDPRIYPRKKNNSKRKKRLK